jgi:hypothetical protein
VTELDAALSGPGPKELTAATLIVYAVPDIKPVTIIGDALPVAPIAFPDESLAVAIYPEIAEPPTLEGAVNVIDNVVADPVVVAVPIVGALGVFNGS